MSARRSAPLTRNKSKRPPVLCHPEHSEGSLLAPIKDPSLALGMTPHLWAGDAVSFPRVDAAGDELQWRNLRTRRPKTSGCTNIQDCPPRRRHIGSHGESTWLPGGGARSRRQPRPGDAEPRCGGCSLRSALCGRLSRRDRAGWHIAVAPPLTDAGSERRPPHFAEGFGLSLINPKGYAAMAVLFSGFVLVRERFEIDLRLKRLPRSRS